MNIKKQRLYNKIMTSSFSNMATFPKALKAILGRPLTATELDEGIDEGQVYGKPCCVMVVHKENAKGTFAVISSILPHVKSMPMLVPQRKPTDPLPTWLQKKIDEQIRPEADAPTESNDEGEGRERPLTD